MLFIKDRTINVKEYTTKSVTTKHARLVENAKHPDFHFNGWRLAQGVAMTISARHLTHKKYWYDFISSLLSLSNLIHLNTPNVRIDSDRIKYLRDFSKTTRIGEASQGLVYLYMQNSGFPYINDFHLFCENNKIKIPSKASTPDFVCQDKNQTNQICLVESKGTIKDVKSHLSKAVKQCTSGETIINSSGTNFNVVKYLGFCGKWFDETSTNNSTLHFVDPQNDIIQLDINWTPMLFHYAAWFYIIGDFQNVDRLVKREKIIFEENYFRKTTINDNQYWILRRFPKILRNDLKSHLDFHVIEDFLFYTPFGGSIGISDEIIKRLISQDYKGISEINFSNESTENYESFIDGTIIIKSSRNE